MEHEEITISAPFTTYSRYVKVDLTGSQYFLLLPTSQRKQEGGKRQNTKGTPTSSVWFDRWWWGPPPPLPPKTFRILAYAAWARLPVISSWSSLTDISSQTSFFSDVPPLQHNNNCHLARFLRYHGGILHCDCPSRLNLLMHCSCPSSLLSFMFIVLHQDWRPLVHITHIECTLSSRSIIQYIYVHFRWVNVQLIGISFSKWNH